MRTKKISRIDKDNLILGYMLRYGSIARHTAATHFNVWDLQNVIYRLRKRGHEIECSGQDRDLKYTLPEVADKYKKKEEIKG